MTSCSQVGRPPLSCRGFFGPFLLIIKEMPSEHESYTKVIRVDTSVGVSNASSIHSKGWGRGPGIQSAGHSGAVVEAPTMLSHPDYLTYRP